MSKGDGKIIAIKFTEPLLGDVTGNETHFTISGKEYEYVGDVNGELIDTEYEVEKVERYPIQRVWELGNTLELDSSSGVVVDYLLSSGGTALNSRANRDYGQDITLAKDVTISHILFDGRLDAGTTYNLFIETTTGATLRGDKIASIDYIPSITETKIHKVKLLEPISINQGTRIVIGIGTSGEYGVHFDTTIQPNEYVSSSNRSVFATPFNGSWISGSSRYRNGFAVYSFTYNDFKEYIKSVGLTGEYRLNWFEHKPIDTNIIIEYTTGETQGQWQAVSNGEVVNANTNLWIKTTLSTEDEKVTPTLQDLWIEPLEAPADTIRLTVNDYTKFHNVAGDLTVFYDGAGSLAGFDGPVEGFVESFTPTELVAKPHQNNQEHIEISDITATGALTRIYFSDIDQAEDQGHIEVLGITATGVLTHINDI